MNNLYRLFALLLILLVLPSNTEAATVSGISLVDYVCYPGQLDLEISTGFVTDDDLVNPGVDDIIGVQVSSYDGTVLYEYPYSIAPGEMVQAVTIIEDTVDPGWREQLILNLAGTPSITVNVYEMTEPGLTGPFHIDDAKFGALLDSAEFPIDCGYMPPPIWWPPNVKAFAALDEAFEGREDAPGIDGGVLIRTDQGAGTIEWGYWTPEDGYLLLGWSWMEIYTVPPEGPVTAAQLDIIVTYFD